VLESSKRSERDEKCEDFLAEIDRIDAQTKVSSDKMQRKKLERLKSDICRQFATYLIESNPDHSYQNRTRHVFAAWLIAGVESKRARVEADAWMRSRGRYWKNGAPELREELAVALARNEPIPTGYFGLHVKLTVVINKGNEQDLSWSGNAATLASMIAYPERDFPERSVLYVHRDTVLRCDGDNWEMSRIDPPLMVMTDSH
jgi:hypothetical protein